MCRQHDNTLMQEVFFIGDDPFGLLRGIASCIRAGGMHSNSVYLFVHVSVYPCVCLSFVFISLTILGSDIIRVSLFLFLVRPPPSHPPVALCIPPTLVRAPSLSPPLVFPFMLIFLSSLLSLSVSFTLARARSLSLSPRLRPLIRAIISLSFCDCFLEQAAPQVNVNVSIHGRVLEVARGKSVCINLYIHI